MSIFKSKTIMIFLLILLSCAYLLLNSCKALSRSEIPEYFEVMSVKTVPSDDAKIGIVCEDNLMVEFLRGKLIEVYKNVVIFPNFTNAMNLTTPATGYSLLQHTWQSSALEGTLTGNIEELVALHEIFNEYNNAATRITQENGLIESLVNEWGLSHLLIAQSVKNYDGVLNSLQAILVNLEEKVIVGSFYAYARNISDWEAYAMERADQYQPIYMDSFNVGYDNLTIQVYNMFTDRLIDRIR